MQLNKKTCIRPTSMGIEFVGFRIWSTHIKLLQEDGKELKRRLKYMFAAYHAGEIDKDTLDRSVASYRGILQHFNSYGMRQSINERTCRKWASHIQNRRRSQPTNAVYSADITAALMIISSSQKKRR